MVKLPKSKKKVSTKSLTTTKEQFTKDKMMKQFWSEQNQVYRVTTPTQLAWPRNRCCCCCCSGVVIAVVAVVADVDVDVRARVASAPSASLALASKRVRGEKVGKIGVHAKKFKRTLKKHIFSTPLSATHTNSADKDKHFSVLNCSRALVH